MTETALQHILTEEAAQNIYNDLSDTEDLLEEDEEMEDVQGWEIAFRIDHTDVPVILSELEEMLDDEQ